jgi:hypothetical protein
MATRRGQEYGIRWLWLISESDETLRPKILLASYRSMISVNRAKISETTRSFGSLAMNAM